MASAVEICLAQEAKLKDTQVKENAVRFNPTTYLFERWTGSAWTPVGSSIDESNLVHKTGNETISGTKTFNDTIVGSVSGNSGASDKATKLATARTIRTNLSSASTASFDGSANVTPGVTGILPVANGGTGNSTGKAPSAVTADSAVKDGAGNTIADTYIKTVNNKAPSDGNVNIAARNVGDEWFSYTGKIPAGGVPYCGQTVTRATYADLWAYVQDKGLVKTEDEWQALNTWLRGNVPFYSDGDGSSTFRMPKVVGYIKGTASVDGAGVYTAEGLPDPTLDFLYRKDSTSSGVLAEIYGNDGYTDASPIDTGGEDEYMQSSLAFGSTAPYAVITTNKIYGNSEHVTPETTTVLFGVYAYGELTVTGSTTTDALVTGLATLESNVDAQIRVIETWKSEDGISWYRKWSDGWIEQGGKWPFRNSGGTMSITLPIAFSNTDYTIVIGSRTADDESNVGRIYSLNRSCETTSFTANNNGWSDLYVGLLLNWYACGY